MRLIGQIWRGRPLAVQRGAHEILTPRQLASSAVGTIRFGHTAIQGRTLSVGSRKPVAILPGAVAITIARGRIIGETALVEHNRGGCAVTVAFDVVDDKSRLLNRPMGAERGRVRPACVWQRDLTCIRAHRTAQTGIIRR